MIDGAIIEYQAMRILLFTQYYTPEPAFRPCDLGPSLVKRGHRVVVLTGSPCYPQGKIYDGYRAASLRWETIEDVDVLRMPVFPDHSQSTFRRTAYYSSIAAGALFAGPLLAQRFDAAFVYSPPVTLGLPAILTKWIRGVPFVYDVQDLFPESLIATGLVKNGMVLRSIEWIQRQNLSQAAAVSVISPGFKKNLIAQGVGREKIHVLPNWADEALYHPMTKDVPLSTEPELADTFNIMYAGNMGIPQSLRNAVLAAELVQDLRNVRFVFVGDGVQKAELQQEVIERKLDNVRFLASRQANEMSQLYAQAAILLLHLRKDPLFAITIPSKTIAYLAVGKPILAAVEGDAAEVVTAAGAGIVCPPDNPSELAAKVRLLHSLTELERERMGQNGRAAFLKNYTKNVLVDRFEELFSSIWRTRAK